MELDPSMLYTEEVWFCVACTRLSVTDEVKHGICHMLNTMINRFFFNPTGNNLRTTGVLLPLQQPLLLQAKMGCILGDEPALHDALLCNGHAGLRCCALCDVILRQYYTGSMRHVSVSHSSAEMSTSHTDDFVRQLLHRLRQIHATETRGVLKSKEVNLGFTHS